MIMHVELFVFVWGVGSLNLASKINFWTTRSLLEADPGGQLGTDIEVTFRYAFMYV